MDILKYIAVIIAGYLLGSMSIAIIISKGILRRDVRSAGSGNAGATNVARVFGMSLGIATLAGDCLKTVAAMVIGRLLLGVSGGAVAGAACLIGHCWPVYYGFKGGKGVAVGAALAAMTDWRLLVALIVVFTVVFILTKRVSAGSLASAVAFPVIEVILGITDPFRLGLGIITCMVVVFMHRSNIVRLASNTEPEFVPKDTKEK